MTPHPTKPNVFLYPIEKLVSAEKKDLVQIFRDCWWTTDGEGNTFWFKKRSPQCNRDEALSKKLSEQLYPGSQVIHIPLAFVPIRSNDFSFDL